MTVPTPLACAVQAPDLCTPLASRVRAGWRVLGCLTVALAASAASLLTTSFTPLGALAQAPPALEGDRVPPGHLAPVAPGDKIVMRVWREPTWSETFSVDIQGDLTLPRIGRVHAVGLTPAALRDTIQARLAVYLREPIVDVVLLRRVAVLGAVLKPDVLYVEPVTSVRVIIAQAGGMTEIADPDRIDVLRDGQRIRLGRWRDIAESSSLVRSGDQIVVGKQSWLSRNALTAVSSLAVVVSLLVSALRR